MKTRNVIQAFQETLMDLPIADREERLQLFTEKLDALEDAQARRSADSGIDQGWGELTEPAAQTEEDSYKSDRQASHYTRSRPQASRATQPTLIIVIALAILAVVEAVTIGVILIFGGKQSGPEGPSPAPSGIVAEPGETTPAPSASDTLPEPSQSPVSPSPSASASASLGTGDGTAGDDPAPSDEVPGGDPAPSDEVPEGDPAPSDEVSESSPAPSADGTEASNAPEDVNNTVPAE